MLPLLFCEVVLCFHFSFWLRNTHTAPTERDRPISTNTTQPSRQSFRPMMSASSGWITPSPAQTTPLLPAEVTG